MPRTKQSPRKNLRDIPNPTNWASNLRHNNCMYFYFNLCARMRSDSISCGQMGIFCGWMGLSHHNLSTFALYFMLLFYPTLRSDGCIMRSDGYMMRSDGYSLQLDAGPCRIFNFTFFLFINSCQQHPFDSLWRPSRPTGPCDDSC